MYESFFECRQRPFAAAPLVERYYPGRTIDAARHAIERCVERAEGTVLVVGPAGTGKTLLAQKLAARFRESLSVVLLGSGALTTRRAFLQAVLHELGLPFRGLDEGELRLALADRLTGPTSDRSLLLIIDDAHLLPQRLLEELRLLGDLARRGEPRVRTVLVGASSLEERLSAPRLAALEQRITTRAYLEAFDHSDTLNFVRQQIASAGGDPFRVFTDAALETIYRATEGIPRLINQTCDHALVLACAGGIRPIDTSGIEEAWADLQQLPTPWSTSKGYAGPGDALPHIDVSSKPTATKKAVVPAAVEADSSGDVIEFIAQAPRLPDEEMRQTFETIETQLAEWEADYTPAPKTRPEVEMLVEAKSSDPFAEDFVEEEPVNDRYAATDRLRTKPHMQVYGADENLLLTLREAQTAIAETPALRVAPAPEPAAALAAPPVVKLAEPNAASAASTVEPIFEYVTTIATVEATPTPHARFVKSSDPVEPEDLILVAKRTTADADMIVVEDDPNYAGAPAPEGLLVRKQDYRQMFARLRRGNS